MAERSANGIREQLLAEIHLGHLRPGDRLPSIRELERRTGLDQRRLARIYRELQDEGLLEIRGRSGVYLTRSEGHEPRISEMGRWAAAVAVQAWLRRIGVRDVSALLHELTQSVRLRCLFIESSKDQIDQFSEELHGDFGFEVSTLNVYSLRHKDSAARAAAVAEAAERVDIVATTIFHAHSTVDAAKRAGKECVVITLNDAAATRLDTLLSDGPIVLVAEDRNHRERVQVLQPQLMSFITVVTVEQAHASLLPQQDRVYLTRSAKRADPTLKYPLLFPYDLPVICAAAAEELCTAIVNENMSATLRAKESLLSRR